MDRADFLDQYERLLGVYLENAEARLKTRIHTGKTPDPSGLESLYQLTRAEDFKALTMAIVRAAVEGMDPADWLDWQQWDDAAP